MSQSAPLNTPLEHPMDSLSVEGHNSYGQLWRRHASEMFSTPRFDKTAPADVFKPAFEVLRPTKIVVPALFNSPHSGNHYPASFIAASRLDPLALRKSEDAMVDELLGSVPTLGAPLLKANFPRAYLDVNREPYELDPTMFTTPLPDYVNTTSLRVASGLGTIARIVSETEEIYSHPMSFAQAQARIRGLYLPYHHQLERLLNEIHALFNTVLLIDCHSMPSSGFSDESLRAGPRPDIVLGDRYGSTCRTDVAEYLEFAFKQAGYSVARNKPYAGGYITQTYSHQASGCHTVQIEINRALYMNEKRLEPHEGFFSLRSDLRTIMAQFLDALPDILHPYNIAAE